MDNRGTWTVTKVLKYVPINGKLDIIKRYNRKTNNEIIKQLGGKTKSHEFKMKKKPK